MLPDNDFYEINIDFLLTISPSYAITMTFVNHRDCADGKSSYRLLCLLLMLLRRPLRGFISDFSDAHDLH